MSANNNYQISEINKVKRGAHKASYDKGTIYSILDASEICHIALLHEGKPFVQPINFGRNDDKIYLHGSPKNRMTNALIQAKEVCLNVTIMDSMKLTRSAFHHSVNYRSAMVFGKVRELTDDNDKLNGLKSIINHFVPDRWEHCRKPNKKELKATRVLEITIESASAKIADSPPSDNKEDYSLDCWAGEMAVKTVCEYPIPDEHMKKNAPIPKHVLDFYDKRKNGK
jgi:nitroimidazol reductase NimA-like FMN-containing flavoprotein (pyridoxamine 5'-phosphate oxidase superfamily)